MQAGITETVFLIKALNPLTGKIKVDNCSAFSSVRYMHYMLFFLKTIEKSFK